MDKKIIINKIIKEGLYQENKDQLLDFFKDPNILSFLLRKLPEKFEDLKSVDFILNELLLNNYSLVFSILHKSISNKNNKLILKFVINNFDNFVSSQNIRRDPDQWILLIVSSIMKETPEHDVLAYQIILKYFDKNDIKNKERTDNYNKQILGEILNRLYEIYYKRNENKKIENLINCIFDNFNIVHDQGHYYFYTPSQIFEILRKYLANDFTSRFKYIKKKIIDQFDKDFQGRDIFGYSYSSTNDNYTLENNVYIEKVFSPAIIEFYNKEKDKVKAWNYLKELCIFKKISKANPDFICEAFIPLLIQRYKKSKGDKKRETLEILRVFIVEKNKGDYIYSLVKNSDLTDDDKWKIILIGLNNKVPLNVFIEQMTVDIAINGNKQARKVISKWFEDPAYYKQTSFFGKRQISYTINKFLSSEDPELIEIALLQLEKFIRKNIIDDISDEIRINIIAEQLAVLLTKEYNQGLKFLKTLKDISSPGMNQQMLMFQSIHKISDQSIQIKIYKDFIKPLLDDYTNNINKFIKEYNNTYARQSIVQFAENLAKSHYYNESLEIVSFFMNDPNPSIKNEKDDEEGKFNMHNKVASGEDVNIITSVRGHIPWVLQKFVCLKGRDFISSILPFVKKLSIDENYYVRVQATVPLTELARSRLMIMPKNKNNFIKSKKDIIEIERIAFDMLLSKENQQLLAVMNGLVRVFGYVRNLDNIRAMSVLKIFKKSHDEILRDASPLFIFFAEYRENAYKGARWKHLEKFNPKPFKELLIDILNNSSESLKSSFAWQFCSSANPKDKKSKEDNKRDFNVGLKYMKILVKQYSPDVYDNLYRFINDHLSNHYKEVFPLLKDALKTEKEALNKGLADKIVRNFYYKEFLGFFIDNTKREDFIDIMDIISQYKKEPVIYLIDRISDAIDYLAKAPKTNKKVKKIFKRLIKLDSLYQEQYSKWQD